MGKAAVRGEKGVIDVTMLVRNKPFGEWVTVYYDADETTEKALLALLRTRRCPKAALIRTEGRAATVMNPFVAPGDTVQVRIAPGRRDALGAMTLPDGWKVGGGKNGGPVEEGVSIQVPREAAQGEAVLDLRIGDRSVKLAVTVVRKV